ncbi:unnamed protein product [Durusdinium trenchii]|uniref:Major facilitator superfamily (MFS) profile domain-containing protein n=1 Tax=Durusdinium trenchii TaxID=1381693 RepID=A0ABP0KVA1_9DINO
MRWQPCDQNLSFRDTWHWLPREEEEELLEPISLKEALEELLDCHKRFDPSCWACTMDEEVVSSAASVVTTQQGSFATQFFIGDDDSSSAPESHTLDCENFYIGDETKSSGEHWEMESIFECSWSSVKDPLEEHFERASGSDSSDHELSKLNSRETRLVPEVPEQKVISLADHLDWRSSKTNEKDAETERWRQLHPPGPFATQTTSGCRDIQRQNRVTLQLASLVQTAHPLFDELGREGYVHKRIHRKLHEKVVHFDDAQIKRLGEMCFRDQFAEAVKMDKVLGSALGLQIQEIANNRVEQIVARQPTRRCAPNFPEVDRYSSMAIGTITYLGVMNQACRQRERERVSRSARVARGASLRYFRFHSELPHPVPAERPAQKPGSGWPEQCPPMSLGEQEDLLVLVLLLVREFRSRDLFFLRGAIWMLPPRSDLSLAAGPGGYRFEGQRFAEDVINPFEIRFDPGEESWKLHDAVEVGGGDLEERGEVGAFDQDGAKWVGNSDVRNSVYADAELRCLELEMLLHDQQTDTDWYFPAHPWHAVVELPKFVEGEPVIIPAGEPLCRLTPVRRGSYSAAEMRPDQFKMLYEKGQAWLEENGRPSEDPEAPAGALDIRGCYARQQRRFDFQVKRTSNEPQRDRPTDLRVAISMASKSCPELTAVAPAEISSEAGEHRIEEKSSEEKTPPRVALVCLLLVNIVEGIDTQLIPGCLYALQKDIGLTLGDVAILTSVQMFLTNVAAPFWGIIADRGLLQRRSILTLGCLGEAVAIMVLSFVPSMVPMVFLRAMSGFFMASLRPVCNGLVADMTSDHHRGRVFGQMQSAFMCGMFCATMVAGNMANLHVWRIPGWRIVFFLGSLVAYLVTFIVWKFMMEPSRSQEELSQNRSVISELWTVLRFLRIPTFSIMILQGIFGGMPWTIMGNNLLFFKLCGLPDWQASILTSEFTVMATFGSILGGLVADFLAKRLGLHGRPLSAQITVAIGIPLENQKLSTHWRELFVESLSNTMYLQFWGIPAGEGGFWTYLVIIAAFGLLGTWAGSGTNLPILSHIVPPGERSKVMAWEGALESSLATAVGPASVSILAKCIFGYNFGEEEKNGKSIEAATALGKAMAVSICLPWIVTFLVYTLMHWSYPRDIRHLKAHEEDLHADANTV